MDREKRDVHEDAAHKRALGIAENAENTRLNLIDPHATIDPISLAIEWWITLSGNEKVAVFLDYADGRS